MSAESPAWRPQVMVALITLVCLVPFLNKAYHMDDTLFLWAARHIREHAANFYGFNANWYGYAMPMHQIMQNPPGGAYFVAGAAALGGWRELWLHSVFLLPAIAAALGTFRLARRLSSRPAVGALCAVLTPAFMVSATNLMADVLMLACYTWAIAFWVEGLEDRHTGRLIISSLLIAAAALTKYFGLSLLPLLGAYAWFYHRKQAGMAMAWLLLPLAVLWLYETYSSRLYGQGLIFGALDYSAMVAVMNAAPLQRLGTGLSFLGGGLIGTILFIPWLWPRRRWILGAGIYLLLALAAVTLLGKLVIAQGKWMEQAGSCFRAQYILFVGGGLHLVLLAASEFRARRDGHSFLLLCWFLGTFAFAAALNWTVSVRSLLPLAPAAGILIARRLGRLPPAAGPGDSVGTAGRLRAGQLCGGLGGLCLGWLESGHGAQALLSLQGARQHGVLPGALGLSVLHGCGRGRCS